MEAQQINKNIAISWVLAKLLKNIKKLPITRKIAFNQRSLYASF